MLVYVDILRSYLPNPNWKYRKSCHLFADNEKELHTFAKRLGLKRSWFQNHSRLVHYDLTEGKRLRAVQMGAEEVDLRTTVSHMKKRLPSIYVTTEVIMSAIRKQ